MGGKPCLDVRAWLGAARLLPGEESQPRASFCSAGARLCVPFPGEIQQSFPPALLPKASCPAKAVVALGGETEAHSVQHFPAVVQDPKQPWGGREQSHAGNFASTLLAPVWLIFSWEVPDRPG